jgi:hypothetical protein
MKAPRYMKVTIGGTDRKLYANIKIKRWGWGWLAFTTTKPTRWWNTPAWLVMCLWVAIKGLAGKMA